MVAVLAATAPSVAGDGGLEKSSPTPNRPSVQGRVTAHGIQEAKLTAADSDSLAFGAPVAIDGDTLVVGASDAAYSFTRLGNTWMETAKLRASDGVDGDQFGISLALRGDTLVVGAATAIGNGTAGQGAVYVFARTGDAWTQTAKLIASDGLEGDAFGRSVAFSGDRLVVGAPGVDGDENSGQGAIYMFTRVGDAWTETAKLVTSDLASEGFGLSVSVDGDAVVVGAPFTHEGVGAAYVFTRTNDAWMEAARLAQPLGGADHLFGVSVAVEADTVVVGGDGSNIAGIGTPGAVFVFTRTEDTWTQTAKVVASDGFWEETNGGDRFGASVALAGGALVVGAPHADIRENFDQGAAYVFTRTGDTWTERAKLLASDGAESDRFGGANGAVALSGNTVVVGAPSADINGNQDQGAAYTFSRTIYGGL